MGFAKAKLGFASQNLGQLLLRPALSFDGGLASGLASPNQAKPSKTKFT